MARQDINIGSTANDGTGDTIRDGGDKINDNFIELYESVREWAPNWTGDASWYLPANAAMTIEQGNASIGTGTITFEKSTAAAPETFSSTTLPAMLEEGAWLKVTATSVSGFCATHLRRV